MAGRHCGGEAVKTVGGGLLTTDEVAELLRVSRTTVRRHIQEGKLAAVKIGRLFRVRREDLDHFVERSRRF